MGRRGSCGSRGGRGSHGSWGSCGSLWVPVGPGVAVGPVGPRAAVGPSLLPPPEVQLKPRHRPLRLVRQWPELLLRFSLGSHADIAQDEPCLQLRRNVFFPKSKELELEEEELLRLLYEEARGNLLGGRYPVDPPDGEELGALACRLRLGPFQPGHHTPQSLRCPGPPKSPHSHPGKPRLPGGHTPPPHSTSAPWGPRRPGGDPASGPPPRCAFFPGAIDRPAGGLLGRGGLRPVSVAVGLEGVTIIDPREKHVLLTLTFPELCWELVGAVGQEGDGAVGQEGDGAVGQEGDAVGPPQLWLEFDGDHEGAPVNRLLRVFSPQVRPTALPHGSPRGLRPGHTNTPKLNYFAI
ncbi:PREDICTED: FERM domain-containing protein 8 [Haliaeetus leucocephalus]|uniref:FERM domain-containing protein 8 n=1 Tax=Haliaeetus leucocephalus TaxID=52644 RepID=UPI00053CD7D3|nr:PREDICTED: FERM domain-containing protein 8 [Haliaeetus leucocephalus]